MYPDLLKSLAVPVMLEGENVWLGNIFKYFKMYFKIP